MKNFDLNRVFHYTVYHYTTQYKLYLNIVLQLLLIPLFFGIITREAESAYVMSFVLYLFSALGLCRIMVLPMRERGTKIMEMTVPVSSEERMSFMLFNALVLYPLIALVMGVVAVTLSTPFHHGEFDLLGHIKDMITEDYLFWGNYLFVQIVIAGSLIINLLARRNLVVAYLISFVIIVAFAILTIRLGLEVLMSFDEYIENIEFVHIPKWLGIMIYALIPTILYLISYALLRKRQVKW